jgi:hypothetical protein
MADTSLTQITHPADTRAIERAFAVVPVLSGIELASTAIGLPETTLLHAGPPFASSAEISRPILNSACVAARLAGLTTSFEDAEKAIRAGEITLEPAQNHRVVTPLASVVSSVMPLHVITDAAGSDLVAYAPINDGMALTTRVGQVSEGIYQHQRWMNVAVADRFDAALKEPIPLLPLALHGLEQGDDCHGRTAEASNALVRDMTARLSFEIGDAVLDFLRSSPALFLNLWMAACKCIMLGGSGVTGSSFITASGGNGVESGIQISGLPGRWFTAAATPPIGPISAEMKDRALGAIGDSAVVELLGLGAMAFRCSPAQQEALGRFLPDDHQARIDKLLVTPHPAFAKLGLNLGITARHVERFGDGPMIGLGILDKEGMAGRLGSGIYVMPVTPFRDAVAALEQKVR